MTKSNEANSRALVVMELIASIGIGAAEQVLPLIPRFSHEIHLFLTKAGPVVARLHIRRESKL